MFFAERVRDLRGAIVQPQIGEIGADAGPDRSIDYQIVLRPGLRDRDVARVAQIFTHRRNRDRLGKGQATKNKNDQPFDQLRPPPC